jgi:hypothetical protein
VPTGRRRSGGRRDHAAHRLARYAVGIPSASIAASQKISLTKAGCPPASLTTSTLSNSPFSSWRELSRFVVARDGSCRECGSTRYLAAHHVIRATRVERITSRTSWRSARAATDENPSQNGTERAALAEPGTLA